MTTQDTPRMSRTMWALAALTVAAVVAVGAYLLIHGVAKPAPDLVGTPMVPSMAAKDFSLTDQTGATYRFAGSKGKAVLLAFLFTHCTDECPFIAEKLKQSVALLGIDAAKVDVVIVSADSAGDSLQTVAAYSKEMGMYDKWHYVIGTAAELGAISDYYVNMHAGTKASVVHKEDDGVSSDVGRGLSAEAKQEAGRVIQLFGGGADVDHSTDIWLIDPSQQIRLTASDSILPEDLVRDVKYVLNG